MSLGDPVPGRPPLLAAPVRGAAAGVLVWFLESRDFAGWLAGQVSMHPDVRVQVLAMAADVQVAAAQWQSWRLSMNEDGSDVGTAELPQVSDGAGSGVMEINEAAEAMGCSQEYARRLCRDGKLTARQSGGRWLVDAASVHLRGVA